MSSVALTVHLIMNIANANNNNNNNNNNDNNDNNNNNVFVGQYSKVSNKRGVLIVCR